MLKRQPISTSRTPDSASWSPLPSSPSIPPGSRRTARRSTRSWSSDLVCEPRRALPHRRLQRRHPQATARAPSMTPHSAPSFLPSGARASGQPKVAGAGSQPRRRPSAVVAATAQGGSKPACLCLAVFQSRRERERERNGFTGRRGVASWCLWSLLVASPVPCLPVVAAAVVLPRPAVETSHPKR
jgi:hypothetical protein